MSNAGSARDITGHLLEDAPEEALPQGQQAVSSRLESPAVVLQALQQSPAAGLVLPKLAGDEPGLTQRHDLLHDCASANLLM